ncbi:FAD-dependent oxidoreductase [Candidatus Sumerlaeota bacterium]|nr:FAD-dependent oxidoreductase [Candidatus Sumerlaeota bacterium]
MNILILGCGFAGLAALKKAAALMKNRHDVHILAIDKNDYATMIPSLPDVAGGKMEEEFVTERISKFIPPDVIFKKETIRKIDFNERCVHSDSKKYPYDYLLIAAGSVTNFYKFRQNLEKIHTLHCLEDALRIKSEFTHYANINRTGDVVISGGGYTGIELGFSLKNLSRRIGSRIDIHIIEQAPDILTFLPRFTKQYTDEKIHEKGIRVITGTTIYEFDGRTVSLTNGEVIENAFVCWCAGTKFAISEVTGKHRSIGDGRILVDEHLRVPEHPEVFACGDSAAIMRKGAPLRKAVNFAIHSGAKAGYNLAQLIQDKPLKPFKPIDLGWVIPLGEVGVGRIFNLITLEGKIPLRLHYFMCGFRNFNKRNARKFYKMAMKPY